MNKFRTYNKVTKEMEETFELTNNFDCHVGWLENRDLIKYSGIKDINNKDLYDGDIVISSSHKMFPYKRKCILELRPLGVFLQPLDNTMGDYLFNFEYPKHIELIGNIYQNPEYENINR